MPRERLREKGAEYLSDNELLAILLGTGHKGAGIIEVASNIITTVGGVQGLTSQGLGSLSGFTGVGTAKASRILAAIELGMRISETKARKNNRFTCSRDIYERYKARMSFKQQEVFLVIGLNNKNEVIKEDIVAKGTVNECQVNPKEVFRTLIKEACTRMVAIHNHPSGDSEPSSADIALTKRLIEAGNLVDIPVLDHIIIGIGCYTSLRDTGIITT